MEVHHHTHAHAKKNWTAHLWEFLMLFLAVTAGTYTHASKEIQTLSLGIFNVISCCIRRFLSGEHTGALCRAAAREGNMPLGCWKT